MYIDWDILGSSYDMIQADFRCDIDYSGTYWAVHNWNNGYAGFQNKSGNHVLLLSIWDNGSICPEIEYYNSLADTNDFDFDGEGTGKHVFTYNNWSNSTWYSMTVATKSFDGCTFYAQWLSKSDTNDWVLIAIIRYPEEGHTLNKSSVFQEDFTFHESEKRGCSVSGAYGRNASTGNWESWDTGKIRTCYYPYSDNSVIEWDYAYNCDWGVASETRGSYVYLCAGGDSSPPSSTLPANFKLTSQASTPNCYPEFPKCIKSAYSDLYVNPEDDAIVQKAVRYWWNFLNAGDGYVYLLSSDKTNAITVTGTSSGSNLAFSPFVTGNKYQMWKIEADGDIFYLYPKVDEEKNMDIEGPSKKEGAYIQIWRHSTTTTQFKWYIL